MPYAILLAILLIAALAILAINIIASKKNKEVLLNGKKGNLEERLSQAQSKFKAGDKINIAGTELTVMKVYIGRIHPGHPASSMPMIDVAYTDKSGKLHWDTYLPRDFDMLYTNKVN